MRGVRLQYISVSGEGGCGRGFVVGCVDLGREGKTGGLGSEGGGWAWVCSWMCRLGEGGEKWGFRIERGQIRVEEKQKAQRLCKSGSRHTDFWFFYALKSQEAAQKLHVFRLQTYIPQIISFLKSIN